MPRIFGDATVDPGVKGHGSCIRADGCSVADDHDPTDRGQTTRHAGECRQIVGVDHQHGCARIVDDGGHFCRRQSPIHHDVHRADQRAPEKEVEVRNAVSVEEGDPIPDAKPVPLGRLCHTTGNVELSDQVRRSAPCTSISWSARWPPGGAAIPPRCSGPVQ